MHEADYDAASIAYVGTRAFHFPLLLGVMDALKLKHCRQNELTLTDGNLLGSTRALDERERAAS